MKKYLLDTHTAIWFFSDYEKLSKKAKIIIDNTNSALYISIISLWEIAIKVNTGKANFIGDVSSFLIEIKENGIELIGINTSFVKCFENLPLIHKDPFDRMLVATAKVDDMIILTADENIHKYDAEFIW